MANFKKLMVTDRDAEENGKWFRDILGDGTGFGVKLRRMTSKIAIAKQQELLIAAKPFMDEDGKLPQDKDDELMLNLLSQAIIVDWEGFDDDDDVTMLYSPEAGFQALTESRDLRGICVNLSTRLDNFRAKAVKEVAKN